VFRCEVYGWLRAAACWRDRVLDYTIHTCPLCGLHFMCPLCALPLPHPTPARPAPPYPALLPQRSHRLAKVLAELFQALDFTFSDLAASIILVGVIHRRGLAGGVGVGRGRQGWAWLGRCRAGTGEAAWA
jgi:hypothetical protein